MYLHRQPLPVVTHLTFFLKNADVSVPVFQRALRLASSALVSATPGGTDGGGGTASARDKRCHAKYTLPRLHIAEKLKRSSENAS